MERKACSRLPNCNPRFNSFSVFGMTESSASTRGKKSGRGRRDQGFASAHLVSKITSEELYSNHGFFSLEGSSQRPPKNNNPLPVLVGWERTRRWQPACEEKDWPCRVVLSGFWLLKQTKKMSFFFLSPGNIYHCYLVCGYKPRSEGAQGSKENNAGMGGAG